MVVNKVFNKMIDLDRSQSNSICVCHLISQDEAVSILTLGKLPPEVLVLRNSPADNHDISFALNKGEELLYEVTYEVIDKFGETAIRKSLQGKPEIKFQLWATRHIPICEGMWRLVKTTSSGFSYSYFNP